MLCRNLQRQSCEQDCSSLLNLTSAAQTETRLIAVFYWAVESREIETRNPDESSPWRILQRIGCTTKAPCSAHKNKCLRLTCHLPFTCASSRLPTTHHRALMSSLQIPKGKKTSDASMTFNDSLELLKWSASRVLRSWRWLLSTSKSRTFCKTRSSLWLLWPNSISSCASISQLDRQSELCHQVQEIQ